MITLELVSRRRNPIKRNSIFSILAGILIIVVLGLSGHSLNYMVRVILMLSVAGLFIAGLFIINYSYKFKKAIGSISFSDDHIETFIFEKRELIILNTLNAVTFRLSGYEGLNKASLLEGLFLPFSMMRYHSGINNFVLLHNDKRNRCFEFYIPNKSVWNAVKDMERQYREKF